MVSVAVPMSSGRLTAPAQAGVLAGAQPGGQPGRAGQQLDGLGDGELPGRPLGEPAAGG